MRQVTFSVIVPTAGRDTLTRSLASVAPQLVPGDELLVLRADCPYGNQSRDRLMRKATGTHLLFLDDDDAYVDDALATIRRIVGQVPNRVHVFRMSDHGLVIWQQPTVEEGNIGTPMVCVPRKAGKLGRWDNDGGQISDFRFLTDTLRLRGDTPVFHEPVVALVRP